MNFRIAVVVIGAALAVLAACDRTPSRTPEGVAIELLKLHGLQGKLPGDRSTAQKNAPVDRRALRSLFSDLNRYDAFTGDLFVGVVVGALAHHQTSWKERRSRNRATLTAGNAVIVFLQMDGEWKISLAQTIPEPMKARAAQEKARYDAARATARSAAPPPSFSD